MRLAGGSRRSAILPASEAETVLAEAFAVLLPAPAVRMTGRPEADATASGAGPIGAMAQGSAIPAAHANRTARAAEATTRGAGPAGPAADGDTVSKHYSSNTKYEAHQTVIAFCQLS